jgi:hypothetical protein
VLGAQTLVVVVVVVASGGWAGEAAVRAVDACVDALSLNLTPHRERNCETVGQSGSLLRVASTPIETAAGCTSHVPLRTLPDTSTIDARPRASTCVSGAPAPPDPDPAAGASGGGAIAAAGVLVPAAAWWARACCASHGCAAPCCCGGAGCAADAASWLAMPCITSSSSKPNLRSCSRAARGGWRAWGGKGRLGGGGAASEGGGVTRKCGNVWAEHAARASGRLPPTSLAAWTSAAVMGRGGPPCCCYDAAWWWHTGWRSARVSSACMHAHSLHACANAHASCALHPQAHRPISYRCIHTHNLLPNTHAGARGSAAQEGCRSRQPTKPSELP